jgi:two-component system, sensor histidine kinase and response regulator
MSDGKVAPSLTAEENCHGSDDALAVISEGIRAPMNGILGMAEVLLETEMVPQQRLCVETIRQLGEVVLSLLNNAIDLEKLASGTMKLEEVPFGLRATVEDAVGIFASAAYSKGLELESLVTADVPDTLVGDPMRLRQILVNLIGNAVKFTDRGDITVTVKSSDIDGDCLLHCEVVDTGKGISYDSQRRISDPCCEVEHAATRRLAGNGLSVVKQLVALHGGEFGVISEPGIGSTFWFRLRFKNTSVPGQLDDPLARSLRGLRVLLVDDNPTTLCLLLHKVSSVGMSADTALDGEGALILARANNYDVILLDEEMPGMDGIEVAKALRAAGTKMNRVMMLTALPGGENQKRAISAGIEWFLTKPVRQDLLTSSIASVVGITTRRVTTKEEDTGASAVAPRILVVDDNAINRDVCVGMLEQLDRYDISVAANGHEALDELERQPYDLVLMDCQMPLMNGYEATGRIREREGSAASAARLPIIALTAYAHLEDREHCLAAGMDDYLAKPFTKEQLRAVLHRWLPERRI